jgi:A/G-specific adenine glycosylase
MTISAFKKGIWSYYHRSGRGQLPWRQTRDPYAILVSEIMLQQTQVTRVTEHYKRFLKRFPNFRSLARAKTGDVLAVWQGLGYNRRALFLHRTAGIVAAQYDGHLPDNRAALMALPGIGKGTSGALLAFAFNKPEVFIETNIRRVFIHFFFPRRRKVTDVELERYIKRSVDIKHAREWYWALMDYGATMPTARAAIKVVNPNHRSAHYKRQSAFVGSDRELRGKIVRSALAAGRVKVSTKELFKKMGVPLDRLDKVLGGLEREGFIVRKRDYICIK